MLIDERDVARVALWLGESLADRVDCRLELCAELLETVAGFVAIHCSHLFAQNGYVRPEDVSKERAAYHLVDVREDDEWQAGHIAESQHIPLGQLGDRLGELPTGASIVAVCRSGSRSAAAVRGLRQLGYSAENLDGGVAAWTRAGLPLVDAAGRPGRVI